MKVLSIKEPFASLILNKVKTIETRSFKTNYRGELYIHTSLNKDNEKRENYDYLVSLLPDNYQFKHGNIICKCILKDCVYMDEEFISKIKKDKINYDCGRYEIGRYAWILDNIEKIDEIPAKGKLGIWNYEE